MTRKYWISVPGSQWTSKETEMLNVEDVVRPWQELLRPEFRQVEEGDQVLDALLKPITIDTREMDNRYILELIHSSHVNVLLSQYFEQVILLTKTEDLDDSDECTMDPPSPKQVLHKRVKLDRVAKLDNRPDLARSDISIPRSSSSNPINSTESVLQATIKSRTERAFHSLLIYVRQVMRVVSAKDPLIDIDPAHLELDIKLAKRHPGCKVIDDGSVVVTMSRNPIINIECKSRNGSTGHDIYEKLFAQEYAEVLAMMLHRDRKMLKYGNRTDRFRVVYSFSAHHRRVYLTKVEFSPEYLVAIEDGALQSESVIVERSEQSYRMDSAVELRELVTMIYLLFVQLEHDVNTKALA